MIYRHDDFPQEMNVVSFSNIHDEFVKADKIHTLAILCSLLDSPQFIPLINYIQGVDHIDFQLHGWEHKNYCLLDDDTIKEHLEKSLEKLDEKFSVQPTVWYLPWNGWVKGHGFDLVPRVAEIAKDYGLKVMTKCAYLLHYLKGQRSNTIYFHGWDQRDVRELINLLQGKHEKHI